MPELIFWLMVGLFALQLVSGGRSRRKPGHRFAPRTLAARGEPGLRLITRAPEPEPQPQRELALERKTLLTRPELRFWAVLRAALPSHLIAPQVAMGALLKPRARPYSEGYLSTRAHFSQKIVDFAVIDPDTGEVLAIVELDDASHDHHRDAARDAMLAQGQYPVFRFANRPWPTCADVVARMAVLVEPRPDAIASALKRASL